MNKELFEKVDKYAISANIKIVQLQHKNKGTSSPSSVSAGARVTSIPCTLQFVHKYRTS